MLPELLAFHRHYKQSVDHQLLQFKQLATTMPNQNLKQEAFKSLSTKTFHCYGASFFAHLVPKKNQQLFFQFMTSYQTLCDYLDNLVDQTDCISETNFRQLHQSLIHIFTDQTEDNYYRYQEHQQDGGYMAFLIKRCQAVLRQLPDYETVAPHLIQVASLYCDLQVYKHLNVSTRETKLKQFASAFKTAYPDLTWYEFSAASGSTLYIFAIIANALSESEKQESVENLQAVYFPGVQLVHIMLDYFVDFNDDKRNGELNFFAQYENKTVGLARLFDCYSRVKTDIKILRNHHFHMMILDGLMALYLAEGMLQNEEVDAEKQLLKQLSLRTKFLYLNAYVVMNKSRADTNQAYSNIKNTV